MKLLQFLEATNPDAVIMLGHSREKELVVDANWISAHDVKFLNEDMPNHDMLKMMEPRPMREGPVKIGSSRDPSKGVKSFIDELKKNTHAHPMMPDTRIVMNRELNNGDDFAMVDIAPFGGGREIALGSIQSSRSGRGNGTAGLKAITDLADKHGVAISLRADAFGTLEGGLSNEQLKKWYGRHGFVDSGVGMTREPKGRVTEARNPDVKVKKGKGGIYNAYLKGRRVGQAQVYDYETDGIGENERYIWKSATHPDYLRKGVATELYNVIAADLEAQGLKLVPSPDQQLSGDAYQFWKARDPESIKGHGTYKAEKLQHLVGRELELRGRPVVVRHVGWSKNANAPLLSVRYTDVPEGSVNSHSIIRWDDAKDQLGESEGITLPDLEAGDELMVGKFKNRKATIKGFKKDKHNQPVAKTDKGDQQIFKGRVKKLMDEALRLEAEGDYISSDSGGWAKAEELIDALNYTTTPYHGNEEARVVLNYGRDDEEFDSAILHVKPNKDGGVHLAGVYASEAGRGSGTYAMNLLLGLADKYGVPITLNVESMGDLDGKMSDQQLTKWYQSMGFKPNKKPTDHMFNIKGMIREPRDAMTESFDRTTTEMPDYDDLIKSIGDEYKTEYFRDQKGKEAKMVDISPDQYLQAVDSGFEHGVMSGVEDEKVQRYAAKMKAGETFPALTLDYSRSNRLSQEGRHRALAAKAVGIDSVPVLVVTPTQEEADYLGITMPNLDRLKTMEPRPMREGPIKIGGGPSQSVTAFMNEYNASTVKHPFRQEARIVMNRERNTGDDFAIIELIPQGDGVYLSSIQSSQGGKGNGAAGLKFLTALADKHKVMLELHVEGFGSADDALSDRELKQWYTRAGFEPYANKHVGDRHRMIRYPS